MRFVRIPAEHVHYLWKPLSSSTTRHIIHISRKRSQSEKSSSVCFDFDVYPMPPTNRSLCHQDIRAAAHFPKTNRPVRRSNENWCDWHRCPWEKVTIKAEEIGSIGLVPHPVVCIHCHRTRTMCSLILRRNYDGNEAPRSLLPPTACWRFVESGTADVYDDADDNGTFTFIHKNSDGPVGGGRLDCLGEGWDGSIRVGGDAVLDCLFLFMPSARKNYSSPRLPAVNSRWWRWMNDVPFVPINWTGKSARCYMFKCKCYLIICFFEAIRMKLSSETFWQIQTRK